MIDAFNVAASRPWAITAEGLQTVLAVLDRSGDPEALAAKLGRPLDNSHNVENRDGVAVIPVTGPIARYSNLFSDISGATSTQVLATDFRAALEDPAVHAIVLSVDSPGGEVSGIDELSQMIFDARGNKPIVAYIGGQGASAAYWIASAADSIVADRASVVGSIGVVMSHTDSSGKDEKAGVKRHEIVSSVSPDKRVDPATEAGRAKAQKVVDDLAGVFVGTVARNRGTDAQTVAEKYGRGGVLVGQSAKDAGMVDSLGSLEGVIASLTKPSPSMWRKSQMANANNKGAVTVANTDDFRTALAAGYAPDQISIASVDVDAIKAAARAEGVAEGIKQAQPEAVAVAAKAERERLGALNEILVAGFEAEHKAAIEAGHTPEQFALAQMRAAKDRGISLDSIRKDSTAAPHSQGGDDTKAAAGSWNKIVARHGGKQ